MYTSVASGEYADDSMEVVAAAEADSDDDDSDGPLAAGEYIDGEEEIMAAVVVDDEEEADEDEDFEGEANAVVVPTAAVATHSAPLAKLPSKQKRGTALIGGGSKAAAGWKGNANGDLKNTRKQRKISNSGDRNNPKEGARLSRISAKRLDAAAKARSMLLESVQKLPHAAAESHVRCFGRLPTEPATNGSEYGKANALYPVGYSCDRFEFSPIHGRTLRMRCSILDGKKIKDSQGKLGVPVAVHLHDGPVFRIMWGQGIDEDREDVEYPYDPYSMSAPLSSDKVDAVAIPTAPDGVGKPVIPRLGMRVQAAFDRSQQFQGVITRVGIEDAQQNKNKKRKQVEIEIQYDDGSMESIMFPDPEVSLLLPEAEPDLDKHGNVEYRELNGLPVHSVVGLSPIEAWSKVVSALGLADEMFSAAAMNAVVSSRDTDLNLTKGKVKLKDGEKAHLEGLRWAGMSAGSCSGAKEIPRPSDQTEEDLLAKVALLTSELGHSISREKAASVDLADKRISALGWYLSNPFNDKDTQLPQLSNWLALAVRKEKTKMGSTGNKKKIVTATDLLERNDTFYNSEIEQLLEGLPGSEYCASYIFQSLRSGGVASTNRAWVQEAQVRCDKDREKRTKATKEKKAKVAVHHNEKEIKQRKRKQRDDLREDRKRQKLEEEEEKKKARIDERLARLNVQVDERLFKEACFQREKAVVALAKTFTREFARRRRFAETVAGQAVAESKLCDGTSSTKYPPFPKLSKSYDEDVLRVWDFFSSFGAFFLERGYIKAVPTVDTLQSAIDTLRFSEGGVPTSNKESAINSLIDLAVALCKPLAASQTRLLFASLIALYPALQKDFGAAFFNEVSEVKTSEKKESSDDTSHPDVLLPVDAMTWQEIARVAFLSDALAELGYSRQDSAHLLRGYRSAGHPNSKEARRLRRVEDFSIALLRQALNDGIQGCATQRPTNVRIEMPTVPSCEQTDWIFFMHSVRSMKASDVLCMKKNVEKALNLLKSSENRTKDSIDASIALKDCLAMLDEVESSQAKPTSDFNTFKSAKQVIVEFLERRLDPADLQGQGLLKGEDEPHKHDVEESTDASNEFRRQKMGLLESLSLTSQEYKRLVHAREAYMTEAMKLKEEMERQRRKEKKGGYDDEDDDDEDEDDEDEDDGKSNEKLAVAASTADLVAAVVSEHTEPGPWRDAPKVKPVDAAGGDGGGVGPKPEWKAVKALMDADGQKMGSNDTKRAVWESATQSCAISVGLKSKPDTGNLVGEELKPNTGAGYDEHMAVNLSAPVKIGKPSQYDDFCGDIPSAPELIRRCLAVLRSLTLAGPSEPFLYPVDPQTNPGYYDMVLRPMCLWKAGKSLQATAKHLSPSATEGKLSDAIAHDVNRAVLKFGRDIRLIARNCQCYANAGPMVISAGGELLRIFERLMLDWVLAPTHLLTPIEELDDDKCVEHHASDEDSTVLLCDGCEGNFNISRLDPPLTSVPRGDWYCPRCVSGRWWGHLDPRIGLDVERSQRESDAFNMDSTRRMRKGKVNRCFFFYPEEPNAGPALAYVVTMTGGASEIWKLDEVDESLAAAGKAVEPIRCVAAIAESQGYGCTRPDKSLLRELVPVPLNPNISDGAAQAALSSSAFRDTIYAAGTLLLINPEDMKASEWLRLLLLLVMKCSASDVMQNLASKLEHEAADAMTKKMESFGKVSDVADVLEEVDMDVDEQGGRNDEDIDQGDSHKIELNVVTAETEAKSNLAGQHGINNDWTPSSVPMSGAQESTTIEVEAAVEVAVAGPDCVVPQEQHGRIDSKELVIVDPTKERRTEALAEKTKRQKAREDSIVAFCIRNQLRPTVASFEEDAVSQVVDSTLASKHPGLSFLSTRCRRTKCDFCGLTDAALGTPLVRVPDGHEWDEIIPHASRRRRVQLVAVMQGRGILEEIIEFGAGTKKPRCDRFVSLSIRIVDELVSYPEREDEFDRTDDGGMMEFCPRNTDGFQDELAFRSEVGLPFICGSMTAHECCAISAHKSRKIHVVQRFKERQLELEDAKGGMACGRTLALGKDGIGRFYWKFHNEVDSLFVLVPGHMPDGEASNWHRLSHPETIAGVVTSLGKDKVTRDLKRAYRSADTMCKRGTWSSALYALHFPNALMSLKESGRNPIEDQMKLMQYGLGDEEPPYEVNEAVLVECKSGKLLWDASVLEVARSKDENVTGYRVRYSGWSSRFDEWVEPHRLVEPSENNRQVQYEMLEEASTLRDGFPPALNKMEARRYLRARDRARGAAPLPDFVMIAHVGVGASTDDRIFALLKSAVLLIEAALPVGSVDVTSKGPWKPELARQWRVMVKYAEGPAKLLRCVILLEDVIAEEWLKGDVGHLRACLPNRWKALGEVSVASVAIRVILLDRGLRFNWIDKKKFIESRRKR